MLERDMNNVTTLIEGSVLPAVEQSVILRSIMRAQVKRCDGWTITYDSLTISFDGADLNRKLFLMEY